MSRPTPQQRPIARPVPRLLRPSDTTTTSSSKTLRGNIIPQTTTSTTHLANPRDDKMEETIQERALRTRCVNILANQEELIWISVARNEVCCLASILTPTLTTSPSLTIVSISSSFLSVLDPTPNRLAHLSPSPSP